MTKSSVTDIEDVVTAATVYLGWKGPHPSSIHLWKPNEIDGIQKALLKWYDLSKRTLPWRKPIQNLVNIKNFHNLFFSFSLVHYHLKEIFCQF